MPVTVLVQAGTGCWSLQRTLTHLRISMQIKPAVEGTLRALRAARNAGVKRIVLTSSFAAVGYGESAAVLVQPEGSQLP